MSQSDEPWVRAAMSDDTVVAEILLRLRDSSRRKTPTTNSKTLNWAVRQRRSKLLPNGSAKRPINHRGSPTTPLSWSPGSEESTPRHVHVSRISDPARSKVDTEGSSEKATSNKLRNRKKLAGLRNEESSLLEERRELKREITALRMSMEKEWSKNENLKRMKMDLQQPLKGYEAISHIDSAVISVSLQESSSSKRFVIPDLNIPLEEDTTNNDVLCGVN